MCEICDLAGRATDQPPLGLGAPVSTITATTHRESLFGPLSGIAHGPGERWRCASRSARRDRAPAAPRTRSRAAVALGGNDDYPAEAMSAGRPFVSDPVAGIPEVASGGGSPLVPVEDHIHLAVGPTELLADPGLAGRVGETGRSFCRQTRGVPVIDASSRSCTRGRRGREPVAMDALPRRLALVLWNGDVGGAEVVTAALAAQMRLLGVEATILFIGAPAPLASRLERDGIPYSSLGFRRGRSVLRRPRRYAEGIAQTGPNGALLVECGFMGAALRAGGYRAPIVAVEHGAIIALEDSKPLRRVGMHVARAGGAWAVDVEVAVSDFVLERMRKVVHADQLRRIHNGIDLSRFSFEHPAKASAARSECLLGFAGRLITGKGADYLIEAVARLRDTHAIRAKIAGEGPERGRLEALADELRVDGIVEFCGLTHDMPRFWREVDVAVVPSVCIEACPMTPLEAMACGKPVVAARIGGLPELVLDGETGLLVAPADPADLARSLARYASDPKLASAHGAQARARVSKHFDIAACAQAYLELFSWLATGRGAAGTLAPASERTIPGRPTSNPRRA